MIDIFKGAKYGDRFITKGDFEVILQEIIGNTAWFFSEHDDFTVDIEDGVSNMTFSDGTHNVNFDIKGKYVPNIDDGELRDRAFEWTSFVKNDNITTKVIAFECAILGYRKAYEDIYGSVNM